ncbi:hypothetical protein PMIN03_012533 [Paraphaeosphaeria minitans]
MHDITAKCVGRTTFPITLGRLDAERECSANLHRRFCQDFCTLYTVHWKLDHPSGLDTRGKLSDQTVGLTTNYITTAIDKLFAPLTSARITATLGGQGETHSSLSA